MLGHHGYVFVGHHGYVFVNVAVAPHLIVVALYLGRHGIRVQFVRTKLRFVSSMSLSFSKVL
jgi:hypothetical protein